MRYNELMESGESFETGKITLRDLNLPDDFWENPTRHGDGQDYFLIMNTGLTSLEGCPTEIQHGLNICGSALTSLKFAPKKIIGHFFCNNNRDTLGSLADGPIYVSGDYRVDSCGLRVLNGNIDYVGGDFSCNGNRFSTFFGAPKKVLGAVWAINCKNLKSLQDIHKHLPEVHGDLNVSKSPIRSHILGVFLIKGLKSIISTNQAKGAWHNAAIIVNKHLPKGRAGLLPCQAELIAAGLDDFAQI